MVDTAPAVPPPDEAGRQDGAGQGRNKTPIMDRSTRYRLWSWSSYFVVGLASLLGSAARAEDGAYPCNKRDFKIPYVIDNPNLRGIYLYVSQDLGRTYTWVPGAMAGPSTPADKR